MAAMINPQSLNNWPLGAAYQHHSTYRSGKVDILSADTSRFHDVFSLIAEGDDVNQRTGTEVTLTSIHINWTVYQAASTQTENEAIRLVMFLDAHNNSATLAPQVQEIFDTPVSGSVTGRNFPIVNEYARFEILHDEWIKLPPREWNGSTFSVAQVSGSINLNKEITQSFDDAGNVTNSKLFIGILGIGGPTTLPALYFSSRNFFFNGRVLEKPRTWAPKRRRATRKTTSKGEGQGRGDGPAMNELFKSGLNTRETRIETAAKPIWMSHDELK